jgi:hypothetical protein
MALFFASVCLLSVSPANHAMCRRMPPVREFRAKRALQPWLIPSLRPLRCQAHVQRCRFAVAHLESG